MRSVEAWILELVTAVPELRPLYDGIAEHDAEAFLVRVTHWASEQGLSSSVERLMGILEADYARRGLKIRGIIEGSFVEPLASDRLAHSFGPNLRRAMRPHALRHRERWEPS